MVNEREYKLVSCAVCGELFHSYNSRRKYCSEECRREAKQRSSRKWYLTHKEKHREDSRNYYYRHHDKRLELRRKYRQEHREEINAQHREYYRKNKERINYNRTVKPKMEACKKEHNGCFDCPTKGECLYE